MFNIRCRFYVLPNVCLHQGGPLCEGKITGTPMVGENTKWMPQWVREGKILACPCHYLEFEISTGDCLGYPGRHIRSYEVRVEDGRVVL